MRLITPSLALATLTVAVVGCDQSASSTPNTPTRAVSPINTPATSSDTVGTAATTPAQRLAQQQQRLSLRLTALDFFAERMWPGHDGEAGLNWLRTSAAGSGLELTDITSEALLEGDGVAVRPVTVQAEGEWADVVEWLQAIEASPRQLVLRELDLHTLRNRVVANLEVAILIDQSPGLEALATMNVADLRGEDLDRAVRVIEAELRAKSQILEQLGTDASWSWPIAELTALLPASARPVNLSLIRTGNGQRAQRFTGKFTLIVPDAGLVPDYIRTVQKQPGFAEAGLESLRRAGGDWQRAAVTFTFTGEARPVAAGPSDMAEVFSE